MEWTEFALRIGLASLAGLLIGLEREFRGKHAGLKTNALVALGASVFVIMSLQFKGEEYADITRVLSQVIIGIGFIGAGTIIREGKDVKGLTTAATIWCSAGAGCLAAFEMYAELAILTVLIILINFTFSILEKKMINAEKEKSDS